MQSMWSQNQEHFFKSGLLKKSILIFSLYCRAVNILLQAAWTHREELRTIKAREVILHHLVYHFKIQKPTIVWWDYLYLKITVYINLNIYQGEVGIKCPFSFPQKKMFTGPWLSVLGL